MATRILHWLAVALVGLSFAAPVCAQPQPRIGTALQAQGDSASPHATLGLTRAEQAWLRQHPVIRVAFDGHFPPYSYFDDQGRLVGLAADVFERLETKLGIRLETAEQTVWKALFAAAQRREIDVVATMGHRPKRESWFTFTRPYILKSLVILTRDNDKSIGAATDLDGRPVALVRDYQYTGELLKQHPTIRPHWVDTMLDGLLAVSTGQADATISFLGAAHYLKARHQISTLRIAAVLERDHYSESIGVRNDWPTLANLLDKALADIPEAEMLSLQRKWLGQESVPGPFLPPVWRWGLTVLVIGAILLTIGTLAWNRLLHAQVRQHTRELEEQVHELERARQKLAESEQRFRSIFNTTGDALFIHDLTTGQILDINQTACDMWGGSREEALSCTIGDMSSGVPPYSEEEALMWLDRAKVRGPQLFEWQGRCKNGELFWAEINMRRARIGADERIIVSSRDITERLHLKQQLLQAQKMESVGTLAGGIAHDFNNILTVIIALGGLTLNKMDPADPLRHNLQEILEAGERAAKLTKELLLFSRRHPMDRNPVDLNDIVRKVESFLGKVIGENILLTILPHPEVLTVDADRHQLDRVLINLATNARDAMPEGGRLQITAGRVDLEMESYTAHGVPGPGAYALLTISDTGCGMDEQTRRRLFEPFFTTKEVGHGTGLGLAAVYSIIEQHDGAIDVISAPGEGTSFCIYLPLSSKDAHEAAVESCTGRRLDGKETLLLVEDDDMVRNLLANLLREFGYQVHEATDGDEALKRFAATENTLDLVITDMIMPGKSGAEVAENIRQTHQGIPIVFTTGYAPDVLQKRLAALPKTCLLSKPLTPTTLLGAMRNLLDGAAHHE